MAGVRECFDRFRKLALASSLYGGASGGRASLVFLSYCDRHAFIAAFGALSTFFKNNRGCAVNHLVSVVIPTYNRAHDLARAVDSVLKQTYPHWEALVIDNHSTDSTSEVVHQFNDKRIRYFEIANNGVIAASRNLGIHHSRGDFIAFLDSDDLWKNDKLGKSIFWLNSGFDVVYHDMDIVSIISMLPEKYRKQLKDYKSEGVLDFSANIHGSYFGGSLPEVNSRFGIERGNA